MRDVGEHGLIHPIMLTDDGMLADGRNRYRACREASVEPVFAELPASFSNLDVVDYILSANLHRRHLSVGQRAFLALGLREGAC